MTRIFTTAAAAALLACSTLPAWADGGGSQIFIDLWDVDSDMVMTDNMKIDDHPDLSNAVMGVMESRTSVPAGEVTFNVINSSKDFQHEMVVAKLDDPAKGLAFDADADRVNEDAPGMNLGEVSELDPGAQGTLTLNLEPGTYALYCNIAGHYASGMWNILTVN